ncbi:hypothetical protein NG895_14075 [Aeoliella sp. ICT_H6.2]|uniref:LTXXQ motif family protein n=1 Tax=Aeoliella straminimaris TaxID=2954799 RepID=A0A9X2FB75_9BACT|nr:hypothetical protein [Aeoliella straminimaris]MCO6045033.1 hypothetical protein [Aeoliella straminimaris]
MIVSRHYGMLAAALFAVAVAGSALGQRQTEEQKQDDMATQSVAQRIDDMADKLGLSDEQRQQVRDKLQSYKEEYARWRDERKALYQKEMNSLKSILNDDQLAKVKQYVEGQRKAMQKDAKRQYDEGLDSVAERVEQAAKSLDLTSEQRQKIADTLATYTPQHWNQRAERRRMVRAELNDLAGILTPEQRTEARNALLGQAVEAVQSQMLTDRIEAAAKTLNLTDDQQAKIRDVVQSYVPRFQQAQLDRRQLMRDELAAMRDILTDEQREQVRNFFKDRVVVVDVQIDEAALQDRATRQMLLETVSDRVEAVADQLNLTDEQRQQIREQAKEFVNKYRQQRQQREELRKEEFEAIRAILTPQQREKVENMISEQNGNRNN